MKKLIVVDANNIIYGICDNKQQAKLMIVNQVLTWLEKEPTTSVLHKFAQNKFVPSILELITLKKYNKVIKVWNQFMSDNEYHDYEIKYLKLTNKFIAGQKSATRVLEKSKRIQAERRLTTTNPFLE